MIGALASIGDRWDGWGLGCRSTQQNGTFVTSIGLHRAILRDQSLDLTPLRHLSAHASSRPLQPSRLAAGYISMANQRVL